MRGLPAGAVDGVVKSRSFPGALFEFGQSGYEVFLAAALREDGVYEAVDVGWAGEVGGVGQG